MRCKRFRKRTSSSNRLSWMTFGTAFILTHLALFIYLRAYSSRVCLCWTTRTCQERGLICWFIQSMSVLTLPNAPFPTHRRRTKWNRLTSPSKSMGCYEGQVKDIAWVKMCIPEDGNRRRPWVILSKSCTRSKSDEGIWEERRRPGGLRRWPSLWRQLSVRAHREKEICYLHK